MKIEEAIQTALQYEIRVVRVYREAMDQAKDAIGKRIFKNLAKEEAEHVRFFRKKLKEWQKTGHVTPFRLDTAIPSPAALETAVHTLRGKIASSARDTEARLLRKALELEVEASAFYRRMLRELSEEGRKLFERFVEIEEGHTAIVQAELDSVTGTGFWFDTAEFSKEVD